MASVGSKYRCTELIHAWCGAIVVTKNDWMAEITREMAQVPLSAETKQLGALAKSEDTSAARINDARAFLCSSKMAKPLSRINLSDFASETSISVPAPLLLWEQTGAGCVLFRRLSQQVCNVAHNCSAVGLLCLGGLHFQRRFTISLRDHIRWRDVEIFG